MKRISLPVLGMGIVSKINNQKREFPRNSLFYYTTFNNEKVDAGHMYF